MVGLNILTIVLSIILQVSIFYLSVWLNPLFLFVLEVWVFIVIFYSLLRRTDSSLSILLFYSMLISLFLLYYIINSNILLSSTLIFILLIIKLLTLSLIILVTTHNNYFLFKMKRLGLVVYVINSKIIIFLYSIVFNNLWNKTTMVTSIYNPAYFFIFIIIWVCLVIITCYTLFRVDFGGYLCITLCLSQYLILFSSLLTSLRLFLICSLNDVIVGVILLVFYLLDVNLLLNNPFSGVRAYPVFFFMFMSHVLGIFPLPSFFIEVNLLFNFFYNYKFITKWVFFFIICFLMIFQFFPLFIILGKTFLNYKPTVDIRDRVSTLFILYVMVYFTFVIYGGSVFMCINN